MDAAPTGSVARGSIAIDDAQVMLAPQHWMNPSDNRGGWTDAGGGDNSGVGGGCGGRGNCGTEFHRYTPRLGSAENTRGDIGGCIGGDVWNTPTSRGSFPSHDRTRSPASRNGAATSNAFEINADVHPSSIEGLRIGLLTVLRRTSLLRIALLVRNLRSRKAREAMAHWQLVVHAMGWRAAREQALEEGSEQRSVLAVQQAADLAEVRQRWCASRESLLQAVGRSQEEGIAIPHEVVDQLRHLDQRLQDDLADLDREHEFASVQLEAACQRYVSNCDLRLRVLGLSMIEVKHFRSGRGASGRRKIRSGLPRWDADCEPDAEPLQWSFSLPPRPRTVVPFMQTMAMEEERALLNAVLQLILRYADNLPAWAALSACFPRPPGRPRGGGVVSRSGARGASVAPKQAWQPPRQHTIAARLLRGALRRASSRLARSALFHLASNARQSRRFSVIAVGTRSAISLGVVSPVISTHSPRPVGGVAASGPVPGSSISSNHEADYSLTGPHRVTRLSVHQPQPLQATGNRARSCLHGAAELHGLTLNGRTAEMAVPRTPQTYSAMPPAARGDEDSSGLLLPLSSPATPRSPGADSDSGAVDIMPMTLVSPEVLSFAEPRRRMLGGAGAATSVGLGMTAAKCASVGILPPSGNNAMMLEQSASITPLPLGGTGSSGNNNRIFGAAFSPEGSGVSGDGAWGDRSENVRPRSIFHLGPEIDGPDSSEEDVIRAETSQHATGGQAGLGKSASFAVAAEERITAPSLEDAFAEKELTGLLDPNLGSTDDGQTRRKASGSSTATVNSPVGVVSRGRALSDVSRRFGSNRTFGDCGSLQRGEKMARGSAAAVLSERQEAGTLLSDPESATATERSGVAAVKTTTAAMEDACSSVRTTCTAPGTTTIMTLTRDSMAEDSPGAGRRISLRRWGLGKSQSSLSVKSGVSDKQEHNEKGDTPLPPIWSAANLDDSDDSED
eukprot:TRINITY_DN55005_c0_g1_i1.p1 TRINITY_DN55005_c0_g1~~TRINITY_DN55005_c0_g1_i1.p1  ORF type:complete len:1038 (-),score=128.29 TRINITY_DN55005_c0_g1_i1:126-3008(-)